MADVRGVLTTLNHALPSGVDPTRLAQWQLRDGFTYLDARGQLVSALDSLNAELMQAWGDMSFITFEDHFEYMNGGAITDMPYITDLDRPESHKGTTVGHMLDLKVIGGSIGGTKRYFRDTRFPVWKAALENMVYSARQTYEKKLLTRFFNKTSNQVGTSGYDVPFANASNGVTYTPPTYDGKEFQSTHTHYIAYDTGSSKTYADMLNGLTETIQEHGHSGPYIAKVSTADVTTIRALTNYVEPVDAQIVVIDRGGETSGNQFYEQGQIVAPPPSGGYYIGKYQGPFGLVSMYATSRIPTGYAGVYKSYGNNDERNAIAVRVHPEVGFGIRAIEVPSYDESYPIESITVEFEFYHSCGADRLIGAAGYLAAGSTYNNPTIS